MLIYQVGIKAKEENWAITLEIRRDKLDLCDVYFLITLIPKRVVMVRREEARGFRLQGGFNQFRKGEVF